MSMTKQKKIAPRAKATRAKAPATSRRPLNLAPETIAKLAQIVPEKERRVFDGELRVLRRVDYSARVMTDSMEPIIKLGSMLNVDPSFLVKNGCVVFLSRADGNARGVGETAIVRKLVDSTDTAWTVEQVGGSLPYELDRSIWSTCHVVDRWTTDSTRTPHA
jgi:hypothetical protein